MAGQLRPEGLDFVHTAPVRFAFAREISAAPSAVFHELAEDVPGWTTWFSAVTSARPIDDGARREIRLRGGVRAEETILTAKEAEVYAYRVDAINVPGIRAMVEEWRLAPAGTGTRVQWTVAADGAAPFRLLLRSARPGMGLAFRNAVTTLDRRVAGRGRS
ncbi:SRPBCC family protein [Streptomyces sp. NPDC093109]|uniref:SRPBCC family protein n=1 Tax=Streptomyces sp. NPDC093109 TaxID=3154977 RepID=UPI00344DA2E9